MQLYRFDVYYYSSFVRPPVFYGQFSLKTLVAAQSRLNCTAISFYKLMIVSDELFCKQVGRDFKITHMAENRFGAHEICYGNLR